jgi:hypothetical protein
MGRYRYRIRVYRNARTVVLSSTRLLYSFGRVPLTNICNDGNNNSNVSVNDTDGCQTHTVQVNGMVFTYLIRDFARSPPNPQTKSVASGQIAHAFFHFDGGPWDLDLSDGSNAAEYVNGNLSCWSASGLR